MIEPTEVPDTPDGTRERSDKTYRVLKRLAILVVSVSVLAFCSATISNSSDDSTGIGSIPKYNQTWQKDYKSTSCSEFVNAMSPEQRFAASADMLSAAQAQDQATTMPSDDLVRAFTVGLDNVCVLPESTLAESGALLYLTERSRFRP